MVDADRSLSDVEFVAFDLETTGLWPIACRIVEFGAVRFRLDGQRLGSMEQLVDPECPIPPEVIRIHGITDAMVRGKPTVGEVLPAFLEFLGGPETVLLAHNAEFDLGFLAVAAAKLGIRLPVYAVVDTLDLARARLPRLANHRLETVATHLRVADREDHRALSDSLLAMGVLRKLVTRRPRLRTLDDLFRLSPPADLREAGRNAAEPPEGYEEMVMAIEEERTVVMVYEGVTTGVVERRVTPRSVLQSRGRPYLPALCHIAQIEKTYRLDRIREIRIE